MTEPGFRTIVVEELAAGILQVRLNRPDRLNAIDDLMRDELVGLLRSLPERIETGSLRVLVVTGTGRAFCAGGDVKEFPRIFGGPHSEAERQMLAFQELTKLLARLEIPVLAAVNGLAVGGGFVLACACDLRVAGETSSFCLSFVARGLGLDLGGSYFVSRLVGLGRALRLALTGETIDAARAEEIGLVQWVVPDSEVAARTLELAQELAKYSRSALWAIKRSVYTGLGSLDEALQLEAQLQAGRLAAMGGSARTIR